VRVEGVRSEAAVVAAISQINSGPQNYDCIVITRGGGSLESLQSFNSKSVVEAVRGSKYPVISAVGHERDVTLCDLAADIRVSTPTDAGKLIDSTNKQFLRDNFNIHQQINLLFSDQIRNYTDEHQRLSIHIQHQAQQIVAGIRLRLEQSGALLVRQIYQIKKFLRDPQAVIQAIRARFQYNINYQHTRINDQYKLGHQIASHQIVSRGHHELTAMQNRVRTYQNNIGQIIRAAVLAVDQQAQFIASHNPEAILRRGYALVTKDNQQISSINQVETGDSLNIRLVDGNMQVTKQ
jgi:exodeoxyribonuclease VII large subunit